MIAYENISKAFSMEDCNTREQHPGDTLAGMALGAPLNWRPAFGIPGNGYEFDNAHWGWEVIAPLMDRSSPLRSTHIRDPFGLPIMFGSESFLDEVAVATNTDPIEFRLRYLKSEREHDLLHAAAKQYGWDTRPSPRNDQARGRCRGRPRLRLPAIGRHLYRADRRGAGASRHRRDRDPPPGLRP